MEHSHKRRWEHDAYFRMHNGDECNRFKYNQYYDGNRKSYGHNKDRSYSPNDYPYHESREIKPYNKYRHNSSKRQKLDINHHSNYSINQSNNKWQYSHNNKGKDTQKQRGSDEYTRVKNKLLKNKCSSNSDKYPLKLLRRKPFKFWDIAPAGYEHVTPQQYKTMQANGQIPINVYAAGQVPMPDSAPNAPIVLRSDLPFAGSAVCRQARRLYVGNIPIGITEARMAELFNTEMTSKNLILDDMEDDPVIAVQINFDKNFSFIEFRSVEETTFALALDGMHFQGQQLKIRRPRDYVPLPGLAAKPPVLNIPGIVSTNVQESPDKLYIGSLPTYLNEDQVKELLFTLGPLKSFNLVKDPCTGLSKGYAFCEYIDTELTDIACARLNNMELGEKPIIVQRASIGAKNSSNDSNIYTGSGSQGNARCNGSGDIPTPILCLMNLVQESELLDDEEYMDIKDDVMIECEKYGTVLSVCIPRLDVSKHQQDAMYRYKGGSSGVGKVFVEFSSSTECQSAVGALSGRKFNNRLVIMSYFSYEKYHNRDFS